ncbi:MAG: SagB/ThcOx family dehydrogenase [Candidatus Sumerlaeia bacterium]|nr:SagB/ThcOx family dehydrogenase [Candidatus Sumerlaeia bacterium]
MNRRSFAKALPAMGAIAGAAAGSAAPKAQAQETLQPIVLPPPEKDGGKSVMAALWERRTIRNIAAKPLPPQTLSNLLWAAWGVNRDKGSFGKAGRTAPSASNSQEMDLYVALPEGVYLYDAAAHRLMPVVAGDFRARSSRRGGATAPVHIFFVVDLTRYVLEGNPDRNIGDPEVQKSYYYCLAGLIAQNVYLFAASQGLAAHFHNCDKVNTAREFKLRPEQRVLFAQTVGYPA